MTLSKINNANLYNNNRLSKKKISKTNGCLSFKSQPDSFNSQSNEENEKIQPKSIFRKIIEFFTQKEKTYDIKDVMKKLYNNIDKKAKPIENNTNFTTKYSSKTSLTTKDGYTIVSMPESLKNGEVSQIPMVVVIDSFKKKYINIGCKNEISHGELVSKYAVSGIEDKVELLAIDADDEELVTRGEIAVKGLKKVLELKKAGANISCINLSLSGGIDNIQGLSCKSLSFKLDIPFDDNNIKNKKEVILRKIKKEADKYLEVREDWRKWFSNPRWGTDSGETLVASYNIIQTINELAKNGVEVFIAAGNNGRQTLSAYSLSDAHVVGAKDGDWKESYSSESSLVTDYAQGRYKMRPVYNENGEFTGITDGKISFGKEEIGEWIYKEPSEELLNKKNDIYKKTLEKFLKDYDKIHSFKEYIKRYKNAQERFYDADKICSATIITPEYIKLKCLVKGHFDLRKMDLSEIQKLFDEAMEYQKGRIGKIDQNSEITNEIFGTSLATPTKMNEYIKSKL